MLDAFSTLVCSNYNRSTEAHRPQWFCSLYGSNKSISNDARDEREATIVTVHHLYCTGSSTLLLGSDLDEV
jgi:hypothetical protein